MPLWVHSLAFGFVFSWLVAAAHWVHVELGLVKHPRAGTAGVTWSEDVSGVDEVAAMARAFGAAHTRDWSARAYGWPMRNWCAVVRDARQPRAAFQSSVPVFAINCSAWFTRTPSSDMFHGTMPLFPGWGESLVSSFAWGTVCYVGVKLLGSRKRERAKAPCEKCGYELAGCACVSKCPECGFMLTNVSDDKRGV